jgi:hypothetical protein
MTRWLYSRLETNGSICLRCRRSVRGVHTIKLDAGMAARSAAARRIGVAISTAVNGLLERTNTDFTLRGLVAELT